MFPSPPPPPPLLSVFPASPSPSLTPTTQATIDCQKVIQWSPALRSPSRGGGGGGGTQQRFIRGGSAPRSKPLPFYIAFLLEKVPLSLGLSTSCSRFPQKVARNFSKSFSKVARKSQKLLFVHVCNESFSKVTKNTKKTFCCCCSLH